MNLKVSEESTSALVGGKYAEILDQMRFPNLRLIGWQMNV